MVGVDTPGVAAQLPDFGKLFAVATALALILSVLYDYCFLSAMGLSLGEVPTTISDHVRSAIIWAPGVLGMMLGGAALGAFAIWTGAVPRGQTSPHAPRNVKLFDATIRASYRYVPPVTLLFAAFVAGTKVTFLGFLLLTAWVLVGPLALNAVQSKFKFGLVAWLICYVVPVLAILVCLTGYSLGTSMSEGHGTSWMVELKDKDGAKKMMTKGIRRFGDSVVVVDLEGRVRVLPATEVIAANTTDVRPPAKRAVCEYLNIQCHAPSPKPPSSGVPISK